MNKAPIAIRMNWTLAGSVYLALFAFSGVWVYSLLDQENTTHLEFWMSLFFSLAGIMLSGFGCYTLFSPHFDYQDPVGHKNDHGLKVIVHEEYILCIYSAHGKKEEKIHWDEVEIIEVLTTDDGPSLCDVFLVLGSRNRKKEVVIPQDHPEHGKILDYVFKFPGFDYRKYTEAMGSTGLGQFRVYSAVSPQ